MDGNLPTRFNIEPEIIIVSENFHRIVYFKIVASRGGWVNLKKDRALFRKLDTWYQSDLGQAVAQAMSDQIQSIIPSIFGYYAVQLGVPSQQQWLAESPIPNRIFVDPDLEQTDKTIATDFTALPFANSSVDLVLLPNTLTFTTSLFDVIHEVDRILMPNGYLIIIGFNPISLWGISRLALSFKKGVPWQWNFLFLYKVRRMLYEIGYETMQANTFFYRPPTQNISILNKLLVMETIGNLSWSYPGGLYILVAQKQLPMLTRIRPIWTFKNIVIGKRFIQPTT